MLKRIVAGLLFVTVPVSVGMAQHWRDWERYRSSVVHPALTIKPADLERARKNMAASPWLKAYANELVASARKQVGRLTPEFVERMIPATTPGDRLFTPCPACRDQNKSYVPHGTWAWDDGRPDEIKCTQCATVFPNEKYPESVELHAKFGGGQTLTFYGGEPFQVFGWKYGRPSFTGRIRAAKVLWMGDLARNMAEAYALTSDPELARGVKAILVRLADVYPNWMVHVGYGEYADMDPAVAAANIDNLPADELTYPPNKPDRKLHTGFWSAGRATGTGMEGYLLRRLAVAYDLTCTAEGVWSETERKKVEKDLFLEATKLLQADLSINNKSVGNRAATAMVGMTVGEPSLVRWGLEGFYKTVDGWFLPDGGTPESYAYALMSLNGVEEISLAARGYSDPPGYKDSLGNRIDRLDLFRGSSLGKIWDVMFRSLQGDLKFPPLADSYTTSTITPRQAEILAANFHDRPEFRSLLKELCGPELSSDPAAALYWGDMEALQRPAPALKFSDFFLPELRIGLMRTGKDGRESLLAMDASHWGSHHHEDSLNLYYWKDGQELLSDLGYLWDHPKKHYTARTVAHNTVVVDEKDQITKERGGTVHFFKTTDRVKAMRASSKAYPQAATYERTTVLIDHGGGDSYAVDFFRVAGGRTRDYVFHGTNSDFGVTGAASSASSEKLYDFSNVRKLAADAPWCMRWTLKDDRAFSAWSLPTPGETAFAADGWGQRDYKNSDVDATIPYVVRRSQGDGEVTFVSVFEGHRSGKPFIRAVRRDGDFAVVIGGRDDIEVTVRSADDGVTVEVKKDGRAEVWLRPDRR